MKRALALWILGLIVSVQVFAQNRTLSGTVTDATSGEPLIGVNVSGKGTTSGTVTDIDGKYTLDLPKDVTTLVFSYVGYATIEKPITSLTLNATLSTDEKLIDEVVVTALGISKQEKAITYNVQKVSGDDLDQARESNIINSLSGKIAGAQITSSSGAVGSSARLVLRGASSLTGNVQPLYVVDGIPIDNTNWGNAGSGGGVDLPNGVASLNPDDIENITVLQGAKAAALYGVRAANGVVLITTKKGTVSKTNQPIGVEINTSLSFERPFRLPDFQNSYGQGVSPEGFEYVDGYTDDAGTDESWGPALDAGLEFTQWNSYTVGGKPLPWVSRPNNVRDLYQLGTTWNNSIALTGGSDKANFRLSFGNLNQKGTVYNTDFNKYNVSLSSSFKLTEKLVPSFTLNYIREKSDNLPNMGYSSDNFVSQTIWSGRNVDFNALKDWRNLPLAPIGSPVKGTPLNWNHQFNNNPYWILENNLNKYNRDRLIGNIQLLYNITDYFAIKASSGTDFYSLFLTRQKGIGTYDNKQGYYSELQTRFSETNTDLTLSYNQNFVKDKLGISLNLSGNLMQQRRNSVETVLEALELPNFYSISNVKSGNSVLANGVASNSNLNTIRTFGDVSWNRWIYVDYTLANDWSSRLPKENNSFLSYSVGGSLVLSELLKKQDVLSFLKLRGSWASVGNFGALVPYRTSQTFDIRGDIPFTSILVSDPATLNNPSLRPERTNEWEVGMDLRLWNNRITIDATYYSKRSKDLLLAVQTSAASGYTTAWKNAGEMTNKGVAIQAGVRMLDKKDYKLGMSVNWAKNKNEVISVGEGQEALILGSQWDMTLEARNGQPYGLIVGQGFQRDPNGNIVYQNGIPVVDPTRRIFGSIQPKWTGGLNFDIYIKGLTISTLFDAKMGGLVHSMSYSFGRFAGTLSETLLGRENGIVGNGVKNIGTEDEPVYVQNDVVVSSKVYNQNTYDNGNTENGVLDASYIKWRQLIVSYELPMKAFKTTKISGISFGVVARNLMLLYAKAPHIDPETAFSSDNGEQGQEYGQLPSSRSIGFNFNIKF